MARTVHRGAGRGLTPQESAKAGALRAAATRARLKALVDSGVRPEIVKAGWTLVRGRKFIIRENWFRMHESAQAGLPSIARIYQQDIMSDKNYEAWMNAVYWGREESKEDATDWPMWSWY